MLEQIEKYFDNELSLSERQDFENQLSTNPELAQSVAFYLNTKKAAQQLAQQTRRAEFEELRESLSKNVVGRKVNVSTWVTGIAASVMLVVGIWWFTQISTPRAEEFANHYIQQNFETLPVKMDAQTDSLQMGLKLFNDQKLTQAQRIFEDVLKNNNTDSEALKYAGITALRLKDYDRAIGYFKNLASQKSLFANPGKFYQALALLQKSPKNKAEADVLLKEVIDNNLEGKEEALKIVE